nr:MAG TPA: Cytosine specific methyltransferase [Caudoviricetes sp.]
MIHLGDITKIHGGEAPVVDVVIGGSPCQDLSIAGKRAGLAGARSGLYMEQIRIIKEMRAHDMASGRTGEFVRPRYMVWENVPGAFSSNRGKDFAAVLEEAIRVAEPEAPDIEVPEKGWNTWGGYHDEMGGRWSVAWRVLDAQHWGVPQRRRRIALVADFGGDTAWEILFNRQSVSGHPAESGTARERLAGNAENGASYAVRIRGGCDGGGKGALVQEDKSGTLGTGNDQTIFCLQGNGIDRADTAGCNGKGWREDISYTLNTIDRPAVCAGVNNPAIFCMATQQGGAELRTDDRSPTLTAAAGMSGNNKDGTDLVCAVDCRNFCEGGETNGTLQAKESRGTSLNLNNTVRQNMVVRRLTPMECERLQGYPDGWTDIGEWYDSQTGDGYWVDSCGKRHKTADSPRYKALGNSIALPPWKWLLKRLCGNYERDATMASLFDGIGGFPLIWEQLNGRGTCLWASEIEEFPIAVTKRRFGTVEEPGDMGCFLFPCGKDEL